MLELWIPITIAAAFLQNLRSVFQKQLKAQLSTSGATFARFVFAVPVAFAVLLLLKFWFEYDIPKPNAAFFGFGAIAALAQIGATFLLVYLFGLQNFAVGTTLSKTEAFQAAIIGFLVLNEIVNFWALLAIIISMIGVFIVSTPNGIRGGFSGRAAVIGLSAGAFFGVSAVCYRAASLALPSGDFLIRGATLLAFATLFQTVVMMVLIKVSEPGQLRKVMVNWRVAAMAGIVGGLASLGWFTAMTLQNAAYVKALAQVELVFSLLASWLIFKEKTSPRSLVGIALVVAGIILLVLTR